MGVSNLDIQKRVSISRKAVSSSATNPVSADLPMSAEVFRETIEPHGQSEMTGAEGVKARKAILG